MKFLLEVNPALSTASSVMGKHYTLYTNVPLETHTESTHTDTSDLSCFAYM